MIEVRKNEWLEYRVRRRKIISDDRIEHGRRRVGVNSKQGRVWNEARAKQRRSMKKVMNENGSIMRYSGEMKPNILAQNSQMAYTPLANFGQNSQMAYTPFANFVQNSQLAYTPFASFCQK